MGLSMEAMVDARSRTAIILYERDRMAICISPSPLPISSSLTLILHCRFLLHDHRIIGR